MIQFKTCAVKVLLIIFCSVHLKYSLGIQVHEHIESDTTTIAPTLLPTRVTNQENDSEEELRSTTTAASVSTEKLTTMMSTTVPVKVPVPSASPTKQSRIQSTHKATKDSFRIDQQPRSTTNIDNKNFVPSPQISSDGAPQSSSEISRENVLPLNTNTKLAAYDPHPFQPYTQYQNKQPILPVPKYEFDNNNSPPYFYNPPPTPIVDNFVINDPWKVAPVSGDNGKWYWMPNGPQTGDGVPATRAPSLPSHIPQHWKWQFENKFNEVPVTSGGGGDCCATGTIGDVYLRPSPTPEIHHSEHPYSFDPVNANKHGYLFPKPSHSPKIPHHHSVFSSNGGDGVFGTQITETEYSTDHVVKGGFDGLDAGTGITGELQHGQNKQKSKGVSPWKKILHVLTAAIPIGLLISAFTPQYVYVDPNSTASQPPFSGKYENRYDQHNHHHIHRALEGETNAGRWFVPSNESLANLFVEVNALFAESQQRSTSTGRPTTDHESDDDDDNGDGDRYSGGNHDDNQRHKYRGHYNNSNNDDDEQADLSEAKCQFRDLCEISLLGAAPNSHVVHRMLWTLANESDERPGINDGVRKLFRSVRERDCSGFKCEETPPLQQHQQTAPIVHNSKANQERRFD